jgi:hypothetical protein
MINGVEHELKTWLDGFVENSAGDHDHALHTDDPGWQERGAARAAGQSRPSAA